MSNASYLFYVLHTEGQVAGYLSCVNRRRPADFDSVRSFHAVPVVTCECHLAMEEPIPNPALSSLKALHFFFSSPGEFCSIAKEYVVFFAPVFLGYLLLWYVRSG